MSRLFIVYVLASAFAAAQPDSDPATYPGQDRTFEFHGAAGTSDTTAVWKEDPTIVAWATGYTDLQYGTDVAENWQTPANALGPSVGDSFDIVCLGRGGQITMTFSNPIRNGDGFDFAVFENGFSDSFLELAWVEVSTDGVHFVRFPNFSYTADSLGGSGALDPTLVHGFASKYRQGFGTPFDLNELQLAYDAAVADTDSFDSAYELEIEENFPHVDLNEINFVRLVDIVGDGTARDSEGFIIYDPFPTVGSAGFDLEAVAVLNEASSSGLPQSIAFDPLSHQRLADGALELLASSSSSLPVSFEVLEGPATLDGSVLSFSGLGQVVVRATQGGDAIYAPAVSITRSFVIADELQHIFVEPVSNQLVGARDVPLNVRSSSGLLVSLFVDDGPIESTVGELSHLFSSGPSAGAVSLRATQIGGELGGLTYAPAEELTMAFDVVSASSEDAPLSFAAWQDENSVSGSGNKDSDQNGATDFEEYVAGTNPNDPSEMPNYPLEATDSGDALILEINVSRLAPVRLFVESNTDLSNAEGWADLIPQIEVIESRSDNPTLRKMRLRVPREAESAFYRFKFEAN